MLSNEENQLLARVGPGSPCGELLRRYWHPMAGASELSDEQPKKRIKILGEELVLYLDDNGGYGLVGERCSHRGTSLYYGFIEDGGIRCPYHGWLYDRTGRCLEQPFEPNPKFREQMLHPAYPVEKLGGLLFTYMGPPERKPLVPRWDILAWNNGHRTVIRQETLNCNWLQAEENSADITHTYFLHIQTLRHRARKQTECNRGEFRGDPPLGWRPGASDQVGFGRPFAKYGFQPFEWGLLKSWVYEGEHGSEGWGHPLIFPNMLRISAQMHWRVPIDDHRTEIIIVHFRLSEDGRGVEEGEDPSVEYMAPQVLSEGEYAMDTFFSHDKMAWETQGSLFDRSKEHLGESDRGIILYRRMLKEQIEIVRKGGEPRGLVHDPEKNVCIELAGWQNEGDLRTSSYWADGIARKRPRDEVFDERHEVFDVPYGAARPRTGTAGS